MRGLSPIIATALLIMIAVILAALIFFWARGFLNERTTKFGSTIEQACTDVDFRAEAILTAPGQLKLTVLNRGTVALFGVDVQRVDTGAGSVHVVGTFQDGTTGRERTIPQGVSAVITKDVTDISAGDVLQVTPRLLGEKGGSSDSFLCTNQRLTVSVTG